MAIWNTTTGRLVRMVPAASTVSSVAFSSSGAQFAFSEPDPDAGLKFRNRLAEARDEAKPGAFLYDTTGDGPALKRFPGGAQEVAFSPSRTYPILAYASVVNNLVYGYQLFSGQTQAMTGAVSIVQSLQFTANGAELVAGSGDGAIRVYNALVGGSPDEVLAGDSGEIVSAGADATAEYVASSSTDGTARIWQGPEPTPTATRGGSVGQHYLGVSYSPDGQRLLEAGGGTSLASPQASTALVLDAHTLRPVLRFSAPPGEIFVNGQFTPDGRRIIALTGTLTTAAAGAIAFSHDGQQLAVAHYPPPRGTETEGPITVQIWNVSGGQLEHTFTISGSATYRNATLPLAVAFSPNGDLLAVTGGLDNDVLILDPTTGRPRTRLAISGLRGGSYAASLAFSPNGDDLAAGSASGAYVWTVPAFNRYPTFQHVSPDVVPSLPTLTSQVRVAFTGNSQSLVTKSLVSPSDETVDIWGVTDGLELCRASFVRAVGVSADGTAYATADHDGLQTYGCPQAGDLSQLLSLARHRTPAP